MGLTIHYNLKTKLTDPSSIRTLVETLRSHAQDLPFQEVGELVVLEGKDCEYQRDQRDDPHHWFKIQSGHYLQDGQQYHHVDPVHIIGFSTWPGEGSEPANFGFCRYPSRITVEDERGRKRRLKTQRLVVGLFLQNAVQQQSRIWRSGELPEMPSGRGELA